MNVAVWDTYVVRKTGHIMHFDIIVPSDLKDREQIFTFGKEYLQSKGEESQALNTRECRFCHIEQASPVMMEHIRKKGYYIIEMENCG